VRRHQRVLTPATEANGYAITAGGGMPRFTCGLEPVQLLNLDHDTRYACTIQDGAIVIGEALEQEGT
jgi:hypothetical protein